MYASLRGTQLFFDVEDFSFYTGTVIPPSKPVLIAVHGGPGVDHTTLRPALSRLTLEAWVVYVDQRGSGRSARGPRHTYTLENNVEDLEALRKYLGFDRIALLGYSYGGMVALSYAIRYPQVLSNLIVVASAASFHFIERAKAILRTRGTSFQIQLAEQLWEGTFQSDAEYTRFLDALRPLYSLSAVEDVYNERPARIVSHEPANEAFGGFLRWFDLRGQLTKITARTLVIGAEYDWICHPEFSTEIASEISGAELHIFKDSGHKIMEDQPEAFVRLVSQFLSNSGNKG